MTNGRGAPRPDNLLGVEATTPRQSLSERFVVPPMTTLFTTSGEWQARRRTWLALGIESELGRGEHLTFPDTESMNDFDHYRRKEGMKPAMNLKGLPENRGGQRRAADARSNLTGATALPDYADFGMENVAPGTSIFDPVLCELIYRWFAPDRGHVYDQFAGGSVRGIVANYLGYGYTGIELRPEQVQANRLQATRLGVEPVWVQGDSRDSAALLPDDFAADLLFTCPPYYDLEVYSDDPRDLSNAPSYADFLVWYRDIIAQGVARLRNDRFAVYVVSDIRDTKGKLGHYHGLHGDTIRAFQDAGLRLYNDAVLINPYGTLPMRVVRQMNATRKLGRSHQNVVIMAKGNPDPRAWGMHVDVKPPNPQMTLWETDQ